ncbi:ABC-type multidrug transport system, ATPase component [Dyadobacter soli]|uniref:ABC-type multidrug transport system, ATPase component n=1 Tax=Dyadobacter soli TaxID=659014 RepID=A0A1G8BIQ4_9BACT|nr:ATP-binding cassette domain-containing protein [Dyadobacter soli]SDH33095.1 ABC-type multidrug transport system, ATPase component [Dyadobacter soli]
MNSRILEADSMWLEYEGRKILQNIYIKLQTGHITGLLGRNGTGKSSLMQMIFGTLRGQSQSVRVSGDYFAYPYQQPRLISYLPQQAFLPPNLRVNDVCKLYEVDFAALCRHFESLEQYGRTRIGDLSTGNRRLVATLLVLLMPVAFTLLDEPFAALSPINIEQMSKVITEQRARKGILISDHAYEQVLGLADETYLIVPVGRSILLKNTLAELEEFGYI